ncbi:hypothetical protein L596_020390 [Steinernema carpocapsae]|nr:hypothetical protein L596_020390 [Steinernema carpocapsae]
MSAYVFIPVSILVLWIIYQMDRERKRHGRPGVPLFGVLFDSITFTVHEEFEDEAEKTSSKKRKKSSKSKRSSKKRRKSKRRTQRIHHSKKHHGNQAIGQEESGSSSSLPVAGTPDSAAEQMNSQVTTKTE